MTQSSSDQCNGLFLICAKLMYKQGNQTFFFDRFAPVSFAFFKAILYYGRMEKLTFKEKCGYSSAAVGDAVAYMFVTTFIMFFLTTVAGLQPAIAGSLTVIGSIWDALCNPIIGYISDHTRSKWGRRRPFMLWFCIPLFAFMILLYTSVEVSYTLKVIYYGFMVLGFWTSFTGFFVPFYALGAEYTRDYNERTTLRSYASFFNMIGTLFSMAMPTMMVEFFDSMGMTVQRAWQVTAVFLGVITVLSIIITVFASKDKDTCGDFAKAGCEDEEADVEDSKPEVGISEMFREYLQVLSLRPMRLLLIVSMFYLIAYAIIMSDFIYLLTYNLGFSGKGVSTTMLARSFLIVIFIPVIAKICTITDKRQTQILIIILGGVGLIVMRFLPIDNMLVLGVFLFIAAMTTQTYWQIMPAIFYDVCEYDEYHTGNRREGAIVSVQGLVEALSAGIGAQILGIILQLAGFNGAVDVQDALALEWIYNCTTWVPAIFLAVAGIALFKFPITKSYYSEMIQKLDERKKRKND